MGIIHTKVNCQAMNCNKQIIVQAKLNDEGEYEIIDKPLIIFCPTHRKVFNHAIKKVERTIKKDPDYFNREENKKIMEDIKQESIEKFNYRLRELEKKRNDKK